MVNVGLMWPYPPNPPGLGDRGGRRIGDIRINDIYMYGKGHLSPMKSEGKHHQQSARV